MKHILLGLILFCGIGSQACDVCNCGPGTSLMGFTPITARWAFVANASWQRFRPLQSDVVNNQTDIFLQEFGVLYRKKSWAFQVRLPYRFSKSVTTASSTPGFGDITAGIGKEWYLGERVTITGGVTGQLPTGRSGSKEWYNYPGTGNYRLMYALNTSYTLSKKDGVFLTLMQDQFVESTQDLQVGTSSNLRIGYYRSLLWKGKTITAIIGFSAYSKEKDAIRKFEQRFSGGRALNWDGQVAVGGRKVAAGVGISVPLIHNINENRVKLLPAVQIQLGYYLL